MVHGQQPLRHPAAARWTPAIADGRSVLLEIDLQGARQVKQAVPDAQFVFLAPPSWDEMVRRLVGRGTETAPRNSSRGWKPLN